MDDEKGDRDFVLWNSVHNWAGYVCLHPGEHAPLLDCLCVHRKAVICVAVYIFLRSRLKLTIHKSRFYKKKKRRRLQTDAVRVPTLPRSLAEIVARHLRHTADR